MYGYEGIWVYKYIDSRIYIFKHHSIYIYGYIDIYIKGLKKVKEMEIQQFQEAIRKDDFAVGDSFWIDDWEFQVVNRKKGGVLLYSDETEMKRNIIIIGKPILDIYGSSDGRYWFVTEKFEKDGQQFISGYVRTFPIPMLAEFNSFSEQKFNGSDKRIWKVAKEKWHLCPEVEVKDINKEPSSEDVNSKAGSSQLSQACSNNCKEVNKMNSITKERLGSYLELLDEISEKTNDERTAVALLQEISKDRRMEQIREEQKAQNANQPATEKQKRFMDDLGIQFLEAVTKKEASVLIDEELRKTD